jgi:hypothetical protein
LKFRANIYVTAETWNHFMRVCQREGVSASGKVEIFVDEYLRVHGEGNPQTMLDYAEKPKCLPLWKTCTESKGELRQGLFSCRRHGLMSPARCEREAHRQSRGMDVGCYRQKEAPQI